MRTFYNTLILFLFFYRTNATITNDRYYPRYHLAPAYAWMNDPNGFSYFRGEYHIFYQHNPKSAFTTGTAHWGHAKSCDLVTWRHCPIAMYPDEPYDKNGVFSGSALIEDDTMWLYYTAHRILSDNKDDYEEHQALGISTDGVNVVKYANNPIISGNGRQPDIRDPKAWKHGDTYYMVLGNKFQENGTDLGRVLLYSSKDRIKNWKEVALIGKSDGKLGYMWECPDFFPLDGHFILLFSPQGVKPEGDKYRNLYQTGYIVGDFDYKTLEFKPLTEFVELDHGHDLYAPQTLLDKKGRRIVIAWFDMWETEYPEKEDGFSGQITLPRILSLTKDLRLLQRPVPEVRVATTYVARSGPAAGGAYVTLDDKAGEVNIRASASDNFELYIEGKNASVLISFDASNGQMSLDRGGEDSLRRTEWQPSSILLWNIFIDASSIEVFCGIGEVTFSSRYFPDGPVTVRLGDNSCAYQFKVTNMRRTTQLIQQEDEIMCN